MLRTCTEVAVDQTVKGAIASVRGDKTNTNWYGVGYQLIRCRDVLTKCSVVTNLEYDCM